MTFEVTDIGNGGTVEIVEKSDLFYKAEYYADRLNDERFDDEDKYIVTDLESAVDVLETATIYVEPIKVKKMILHKMNENEENIEYEYLIPTSVIERYIDEHVDEDDRADINTFLNSVYDSEDTELVIEMCESENIHYELVGSEVWF